MCYVDLIPKHPFMSMSWGALLELLYYHPLDRNPRLCKTFPVVGSVGRCNPTLNIRSASTWSLMGIVFVPRSTWISPWVMYGTMSFMVCLGLHLVAPSEPLIKVASLIPLIMLSLSQRVHGPCDTLSTMSAASVAESFTLASFLCQALLCWLSIVW